MARPHAFLCTSLLVVCALASSLLGGTALAHGLLPQAPAPRELTATRTLPPLPAGVTELRFNEMFKMPIGPKGLEPSAKLLSLNGQMVRMVGYQASEEEPVPGRLVLVPLPVALTEEDESLADDLPASAVFVHFGEAGSKARLPNFAGLIVLQGRLEVGALDEADGRVSGVRLRADPAVSAVLVRAADERSVAQAGHAH